MLLDDLWVGLGDGVGASLVGGLKVLVVVFRLSGSWCMGGGFKGLYVHYPHMKYTLKACMWLGE